jgi:hypothetical protein
MLLKALFRLHESYRVLAEFLANSRVLLQKFLQLWVTLHPLMVVDQRGILAQLLGDFRMLIQELVHVGQFSAGYIAIAEARVLSLVEALFRLHESGGILAEFFADFGVLLQELLQRRMVLDEFFVSNQRGVLTQLFRDFGMAIEKLIHVRDLPIPSVVVLRRHTLSSGRWAGRWRALSVGRCAGPEHDRQWNQRQRMEQVQVHTSTIRFHCDLLCRFWLHRKVQPPCQAHPEKRISVRFRGLREPPANSKFWLTANLTCRRARSLYRMTPNGKP